MGTHEGRFQKGMKFDEGKLRFDLSPRIAEKQLAAVLTFGALKYNDNSWQLVENARERYYAALRRHLDDYRSGEHIDDDSGLHHLSHALACVAFLLWLEGQGGYVPNPDEPEVVEIWKEVREKYEDERQKV